MFGSSFCLNLNANVQGKSVESCPNFWMVALQAKRQELVDPTIIHKMNDRKIKVRKERR